MSSPTRLRLETLLDRVKCGHSAVELVHTPHDRWPYPHGTFTPPFRISILDSSFNPPTRAHLALASLSPQPNTSSFPKQDFDARILLISVRNVDKGLKPTDATYVQRLEMMIRLAGDVQASALTDNRDANVAVAIIDEPTFVGKARILTDFLQQRISSSSLKSIESSASQASLPPPELTFLVGMDTLERILAPRYYPSSSDMRTYLKTFMNTSRLVCAHRAMPHGLLTRGDEKEKEILSLANEYLNVERLTIIDLEDDLESYSSSEVRRSLGAGDGTLWRKMVTDSVTEFITMQGLYQPEDTTLLSTPP